MGRGTRYLSGGHRDSLQDVVLPDKIGCGRCGKKKAPGMFTKSNLDKARWAAQTNNTAPSKPPICLPCSGTQTPVELTCHMCNKTKGIKAFSKAQRKDTAKAECYTCVEQRVKLPPVEADKYEDPNNTFVTPDHSAGIFPDYFSSHASTQGPDSTVDGDGEGQNTGHGFFLDRRGISQWASAWDDASRAPSRDSNGKGSVSSGVIPSWRPVSEAPAATDQLTLDRASSVGGGGLSLGPVPDHAPSGAASVSNEEHRLSESGEPVLSQSMLDADSDDDYEEDSGDEDEVDSDFEP